MISSQITCYLSVSVSLRDFRMGWHKSSCFDYFIDSYNILMFVYTCKQKYQETNKEVIINK